MTVSSGNIMDLGDVHLKLHNKLFHIKKKEIFVPLGICALSNTRFLYGWDMLERSAS